jgi:hypothetical protein
MLQNNKTKSVEFKGGRTLAASKLNRQPTEEEMGQFKERWAAIKAQLENAGLQASPGISTGAKIVRYFTYMSAVSNPKDMTFAQWESVFLRLDTLLESNPKEAVETIEETIRCL